jgi:signal transduction histidine kinase
MAGPNVFTGVFDKIVKINIWHLVWITVVFSEILTAIMDTLISFLLWGRFSSTLFVLGCIDSFVVSLIAAYFLIYIVSRLRSAEHEATIMLAREVEERKKAEDERSALYHMLTHDLKAPLSIIYGYGEILAQEKDCPDITDMVESINKAAMRISLLIDDMLGLSRIESGKAALHPERVSLPEVIGQAVAENEKLTADMDLKISVEVDKDVPEFCADKSYLCRAISNLVANAANYNRQGGSVTVRCGLCKDASPGVFVEVSDTGVGIAKEELPYVFDRYYRSRRSWARKGTGLGLAIVRAVAEAHGGKVTVESSLGKGSTFRVMLPLEAARVKGC